MARWKTRNLVNVRMKRSWKNWNEGENAGFKMATAVALIQRGWAELTKEGAITLKRLRDEQRKFTANERIPVKGQELEQDLLIDPDLADAARPEPGALGEPPPRKK